jgi:hypothetical protein
MIKLSKILRILAAAAFLTALAVNVKVTLTDPFVGMSEEAIATGTDVITSANSANDNDYKTATYDNHTQYQEKEGSNGKTLFRERDIYKTMCEGKGNVVCTPVDSTGEWSPWKELK